MKNMLITGASSGIGFGLVNKFLENDYHVYTVSRRTESLRSLNVSEDRLTIIKADVTNQSDQQKIVQALSGIENLEIINNAAIAIPRPFENMDIQELRDHFEINFFAPVILLQLLLKQNTVTKVINISSGAAEFALDSSFGYCTSKAAIHHAMRCLNLEYPKTKFINVRPGMVETPMQDRLRALDNTIFPNGNVFAKAKEDNKLIPVSTVADFIYWILNVSTEYREAWSIYDEEHHKYWKKENID